MMNGQKEVLAINQPVKKNRFHQRASLFRTDRAMTGQKEALMGRQTEKNHLPPGVNLQQAHSILATGLKKAMAAIEPVKKNSQAGHRQMEVSKNAMGTSHILPTSHSVQNQRMIK
jgi:uncharacterized membrane protein